MLLKHDSTPVILLEAGHHAGLGIMRSLGRLGVRVYAVDSKPVPSTLSRYCRGIFRWDFKTVPGQQSVAWLCDLARKVGGHPALIPTTDHAALFVVDNAALLRQAFVFPKQLPETSHAVVRKSSLFQVAKAAGIPTPETFCPQTRSELLSFLESAAFPLVLKADDCSRVWRVKGNTKCIVRDREECLLQYEQMQDPEIPNLIVQEYIPGGEDCIWMFNGYFNEESECLFGMTGKKIRQCPAYTGAACLAVCVQNPEVHALTVRFMKALGYRGILDIGYRFDARDSQYKVLDVNPRIGATFRLFVGANGMDVARALYLDLTGQPVPPSPAVADGRKWIVEDCDLVSSYRYYRDGKLTVGEWIRSFRGVKEFSFLSLTDPLPLLSVLSCDLHELRSRIARKHMSNADAITASANMT